MLADERTRVVTHHEWVLPAVSPVHESDVRTALAIANSRCAAESARAKTDVHVECGDEVIVVGYTVEGGPQPARGECDASCGDVERDRDEWRRRAEAFGARLAQVRRTLAEDGYTAEDGVDYDAARLFEWLTHHRGRTESAEAQRHQAELLLQGCENARDQFERRALAAEAKVDRARRCADTWSVRESLTPAREALLAALADAPAEAVAGE